MENPALTKQLNKLLSRPIWTEQDYDRALDIADQLYQQSTRDPIAAHEYNIRRLSAIHAMAVENVVGLPAMKDIRLMREAAQMRKAGNVQRVDEIWREARRRRWPSDVMRSVFEDDAS